MKLHQLISRQQRSLRMLQRRTAAHHSVLQPAAVFAQAVRDELISLSQRIDAVNNKIATHDQRTLKVAEIASEAWNAAQRALDQLEDLKDLMPEVK